MKNVQLENVFTWDYPDFADAFVSYAEHDDGTPYTQEELEAIDGETIHELVFAHLY